MADLNLKGISEVDLRGDKISHAKIITKSGKKFDHSLSFLNRLLRIQSILKINKWIAVDAPQGKDFTELAAAPRTCHKLKLTNNAGNDKKRKRMRLGSKVQKQQAEQDAGHDDEEDGVEEDEQRTRSMRTGTRLSRAQVHGNMIADGAHYS